MPSKKNNYINAELEWAEEKLAQWKAYVDDNPFSEIVDRVLGEKIAATEEKIRESIRATMKDYLSLAEVVSRLREAEDQKEKKIRGDDDRSPLEKREF